MLTHINEINQQIDTLVEQRPAILSRVQYAEQYEGMGSSRSSFAVCNQRRGELENALDSVKTRAALLRDQIAEMIENKRTQGE